eukprot:scaffold384217_cov35-Attheya_sp.AAC.1
MSQVLTAPRYYLLLGEGNNFETTHWTGIYLVSVFALQHCIRAGGWEGSPPQVLCVTLRKS